MQRTLFYILGGVAAIYILSRLSVSKRINFLVQSIRPSGTLLQPRINIQLAIQNPTSQAVTLKSLSASLYIADKFVSNVSAFGDQRIEPNSENIVNITARPSALGVVSTIWNWLNQKPGNIQANLQGTANFDGFTFPINETYTI